MHFKAVYQGYRILRSCRQGHPPDFLDFRSIWYMRIVIIRKVIPWSNVAPADPAASSGVCSRRRIKISTKAEAASSWGYARGYRRAGIYGVSTASKTGRIYHAHRWARERWVNILPVAIMELILCRFLSDTGKYYHEKRFGYGHITA